VTFQMAQSRVGRISLRNPPCINAADYGEDA